MGREYKTLMDFKNELQYFNINNPLLKLAKKDIENSKNDHMTSNSLLLLEDKNYEYLWFYRYLKSISNSNTNHMSDNALKISQLISRMFSNGEIEEYCLEKLAKFTCNVATAKTDHMSDNLLNFFINNTVTNDYDYDQVINISDKIAKTFNDYISDNIICALNNENLKKLPNHLQLKIIGAVYIDDLYEVYELTTNDNVLKVVDELDKEINIKMKERVRNGKNK